MLNQGTETILTATIKANQLRKIKKIKFKSKDWINYKTS